jgi:hypothetical protein
MRAYVNSTLRAAAPGELLLLALGGAVLAVLGAAVTRETTRTWTRLRETDPYSEG